MTHGMMIASNGRLPANMLASIPGGRLRKDAAAAWNAMCDEALRRGWPTPMPDGPASSYRTFDQQVEMRREWCAKGQCDNAAVPGRSNHGKGIAVDCSHNQSHANRWVVDRIGAKYGWSSKGSDAPWEEWHMKWQVGVWKQKVVYRWLPLYFRNRRNNGGYVMMLTGRLKNCNYLTKRTSKYSREVESAVKRFQARHHLKQDGVVGPFTWEAIKAREPWCKRHGRHDV